MLLNLFLMLAWGALTNDFSLLNLFVGFVIGYMLLALLANRGVTGSKRYLVRTRRVAGFLMFYILEVIRANLRMAVDTLAPRLVTRPGVVAVPLDARTNTDTELMLLSNLITLTPGTLSIDFSPDRRILYVHAMDIPNDDAEALRRKIKYDLERRVIEVLH
jgi:multicomponent Na+:H+ antiporter subunit E